MNTWTWLNEWRSHRKSYFSDLGIWPTSIPFWFHLFRLFDGRNHIACSSIIYNVSLRKKKRWKTFRIETNRTLEIIDERKPMKKRNWKWFAMNWPNNNNKSNSIFCSQLLVGALQIFFLLLLLLRIWVWFDCVTLRFILCFFRQFSSFSAVYHLRLSSITPATERDARAHCVTTGERRPNGLQWLLWTAQMIISFINYTFDAECLCTIACASLGQV